MGASQLAPMVIPDDLLDDPPQRTAKTKQKHRKNGKRVAKQTSEIDVREEEICRGNDQPTATNVVSVPQTVEDFQVLLRERDEDLEQTRDTLQRMILFCDRQQSTLEELRTQLRQHGLTPV